jgi:hypothetical protein
VSAVEFDRQAMYSVAITAPRHRQRRAGERIGAIGRYGDGVTPGGEHGQGPQRIVAARAARGVIEQGTDRGQFHLDVGGGSEFDVLATGLVRQHARAVMPVTVAVLGGVADQGIGDRVVPCRGHEVTHPAGQRPRDPLWLAGRNDRGHLAEVVAAVAVTLGSCSDHHLDQVAVEEREARNGQTRALVDVGRGQVAEQAFVVVPMGDHLGPPAAEG